MYNSDINKLMKQEDCDQEFVNEVMRIASNREIDWDDFHTLFSKHEVCLALVNPATGHTFCVTITD